MKLGFQSFYPSSDRRFATELVIGSGRTEISVFVQRIPRLDDRLGFIRTRGVTARSHRITNNVSEFRPWDVPIRILNLTFELFPEIRSD